MGARKKIGYLVSATSIVGAAVYVYLVWFTRDFWVVLAKLTLTAIALVGFGAVAWISYVFARSEPPKPVTQVEYVVNMELERDRNHIYQ